MQNMMNMQQGAFRPAMQVMQLNNQQPPPIIQLTQNSPMQNSLGLSNPRPALQHPQQTVNTHEAKQTLDKYTLELKTRRSYWCINKPSRSTAHQWH